VDETLTHPSSRKLVVNETLTHPLDCWFRVLRVRKERGNFGRGENPNQIIAGSGCFQFLKDPLVLMKEPVVFQVDLLTI
jgi:hypothetical protein